jgi:hypothetical protein
MATILLTTDEESCYVRAHAIRLRDRLRVWLGARELDRALARGAPPDSAATLSLRARRLIGHNTRRALARKLRALLREAAQPQHPLEARVPMCRRHVLHAAGILEELASRLAANEPVDVVGVAQLATLLRDGSSPLFDPSRAHELERILHGASEALEYAVPV